MITAAWVLFWMDFVLYFLAAIRTKGAVLECWWLLPVHIVALSTAARLLITKPPHLLEAGFVLALDCFIVLYTALRREPKRSGGTVDAKTGPDS
jgi:hypothetical protein